MQKSGQLFHSILIIKTEYNHFELICEGKQWNQSSSVCLLKTWIIATYTDDLFGAYLTESFIGSAKILILISCVYWRNETSSSFYPGWADRQWYFVMNDSI